MRNETLERAGAARLPHLFTDWPRKLTVLFAGIFVYTFVLWLAEEDGGLLPTTVALVTATLMLTFLTELAPLKYKILHRFLQLLLITFLHALMLGYSPVLFHARGLEEWGQLFYMNFVQLFPYYWFGVGVWMIYLFTAWWARRKTRIYLMMFAGLLAMALRDSFSQVYLWDEAALLILCGLSLLVVRHFSDLRDRHPAGWGYIADYPLSVAGPVVLLLSLTIGLGVMAPDVQNVLKDPYTLYMNWRGEQVKPFGKTSPDVPEADPRSSTSGYSRDDRSLGGGFNFDYSPVFTVETDRRSYWRGETKSIYNGRGWIEGPRESSEQPFTGFGPDTELPPDSPVTDSKMKTVPVKQTITFEKNEKYPVLFGALAISRVESLDKKDGFNNLQWRPNSAKLGWRNSGAAYPKKYSLVSNMPVLDEAGLRSATLPLPEAGSMAEYLYLPPSLPQRVRDLSQQITKDAPTPYDKVKAIETYLKVTYPYTNEPDESRATSRDFVDRFLFETQQGYCDYYSTAMAVMVRTLGMPTRWVKGYSSGSNPLDSLTEGVLRGGFVPDPNGAGTYTVRNADAHSWVEVYFSGWGWVPFEPTSGFTLPTASVAADPAAVVPETSEAEEAQSPAAADTSVWGAGFWAALAASVCGLIVLGAGVWYGLRLRKQGHLPAWMLRVQTWLPRRHPPATPNQQLIREYERLLSHSRRRGFPVFEHETARETLARWRKKDWWLSDDLDVLLALFEKAKYSTRPISLDDVATASGIVNKLKKTL